MVVTILAFTWFGGMAQAVTCAECKEIKKQQASLEHDVTQNETVLQQAFEKKRFQDVTEIRRKLLDLKKNLVEIQRRGLGCADACRPDMMKQDECQRIRTEIIQLEGNAGTPVDRIDALYRNLADCNKELAKVKKPH
jgi:hypothetical protein